MGGPHRGSCWSSKVQDHRAQPHLVNAPSRYPLDSQWRDGYSNVTDPRGDLPRIALRRANLEPDGTPA
jgi:hypothetical protein